MISGMSATVKFDRKVKPGYHYLSPGGYTMTFGEKEVSFDFQESGWSVDSDDRTVVLFGQDWLDISYTPESALLTKEDVRNLTKINSFYIYTGEEGEPEIHPVKLLELVFEFDDGDDIICTDMGAVKNFRFD